MKKVEYKKNLMRYNRYNLESMSNNLFPDYSQSNIGTDFGASNTKEERQKNDIDGGTCMIFDPVGFDEHKFMKFRRRMAHSQIINKFLNNIIKKKEQKEKTP